MSMNIHVSDHYSLGWQGSIDQNQRRKAALVIMLLDSMSRGHYTTKEYMKQKIDIMWAIPTPESALDTSNRRRFTNVFGSFLEEQKENKVID
jgi:hypothetical protein